MALHADAAGHWRRADRAPTSQPACVWDGMDSHACTPLRFPRTGPCCFGVICLDYYYYWTYEVVSKQRAFLRLTQCTIHPSVIGGRPAGHAYAQSVGSASTGANKPANIRMATHHVIRALCSHAGRRPGACISSYRMLMLSVGVAFALFPNLYGCLPSSECRPTSQYQMK